MVPPAFVEVRELEGEGVLQKLKHNTADVAHQTIAKNQCLLLDTLRILKRLDTNTIPSLSEKSILEAKKC